MQAWIEDELRTVNLADERLNKRYRVLLERFSSKPTLSIPAACTGWPETQAAYRFFDNERVTPEQLLQPHYEATLERIRQYPVVLMPQDTTQFDLTRQQEKIGGPLGDEKHWGLHDHVALAVTPERLALGVVHSFTWARNLEDFHKRNEARYKPIEEKESYRWLEGYRRACAIAAEAPKTKIICLSDSEGDIYECFAEAALIEGQKADWIVRACQNRSLTDETSETVEIARKLTETVAAGPTLGTLLIEVSPRPAQSHDGSKRRQAKSARTAKMTVQACQVTLQAPWRSGQKLPEVKVYAGQRAGDRVAAADEPAGSDILPSLRRDPLLHVSLGNRDIFPRAQKRLHGRRIATGNARAFHELPDALSDCGVARAVRDALGPRVPGDALRGGVHGRGMARGLSDRNTQAGCRNAEPGRDDDHDCPTGRLS